MLVYAGETFKVKDSVWDSGMHNTVWETLKTAEAGEYRDAVCRVGNHSTKVGEINSWQFLPENWTKVSLKSEDFLTLYDRLNR